MRKFYIPQIKEEILIKNGLLKPSIKGDTTELTALNKGWNFEFAVKKFLDDTVESFWKETMPHTHFADITHDNKKISLKSNGSEFEIIKGDRVENDLQNNLHYATQYINCDFADTYWIGLLPNKQDIERQQGYYTVIELNKAEMIEFLKECATMDYSPKKQRTAQRIKLTDDKAMTYFNELMGIPKVSNNKRNKK